jgi:hypothetical protein
MHAHTAEKALLAGNVAPPGLALIKLAAPDAIVIAGGDRKTVQYVAGALIEQLPGFTQREEESQKQVGNAIQPMIEAASTLHMRHIAIYIQKLAAHPVIPSEIQHRNDCFGHHFRIRQMALAILAVFQSFQQIVSQAKYEYNLGVHALLRYRFGLSTFTVPKFAWTCFFSLL